MTPEKQSPDEKLDLLLKWMRHIEIDRIASNYRFNSMDAIKQYRAIGIMLFNPHMPYIKFDDYCRDAHFLELVAN